LCISALLEKTKPMIGRLAVSLSSAPPAPRMAIAMDLPTPAFQPLLSRNFAGASAARNKIATRFSCTPICRAPSPCSAPMPIPSVMMLGNIRTPDALAAGSLAAELLRYSSWTDSRTRASSSSLDAAIAGRAAPANARARSAGDASCVNGRCHARIPISQESVGNSYRAHERRPRFARCKRAARAAIALWPRNPR